MRERLFMTESLFGNSKPSADDAGQKDTKLHSGPQANLRGTTGIDQEIGILTLSGSLLGYGANLTVKRIEGGALELDGSLFGYGAKITATNVDGTWNLVGTLGGYGANVNCSLQ